MNYQKTIRACFIGYIVQAIVVNFAPLLFVQFQTQYGVPLSKIAILITLNFGLQLLVDLVSALIVDKIGYRIIGVLAHAFSAAGLILLAFLPDLFLNPFAGMMIAMGTYAIGGGLLEVIISPMVEACPNDHKNTAMSLLHSFYSWGSAGVILLSTLFFFLFGIENWWLLSVLWAIVPIVNGINFMHIPIAELDGGADGGLSIAGLCRSGLFWVFILIMCCAGASEQAVAQWASAFAEEGLQVSKTIGDLAGPTLFAILMGLSRMLYGKYGEKLNQAHVMLASSFFCILAYLIISLSSSPVLGLVGIALTGFSVGVLWPGALSMAAARIRGGGTAMFALMALAGDVGCAGGPTLAGNIAEAFSNNLRLGILSAIAFPVVLVAVMLFLQKNKKAGER